ncbi:MAG: penicillin-binding protein activator LpoB [Atribacterota bacterium]
MFRFSKKLFFTFFLILWLLNCAGPIRTVTRVETDQITDLSGRWNDTDSRLTAKAMIKDLISKPWLIEFINITGRKPVIIVGIVRNKSSEHINTEIFIKNIEKELINSGKVSFVVSGNEREEIREEKIDQQYFSSSETTKQLANETGADHILIGTINSIVDSLERQKVVYYQVNLELVELVSNKKVWIGDKKIKKLIEQKKYKW